MPSSRQIITWSEIVTFLSPHGQRQLVDFIRTAQEERGRNWLPEIKAEFPTFCWLAELVCNKTADEAYAELQDEFPIFPLHLVEGSLRDLHATLRTEIERKRFEK